MEIDELKSLIAGITESVARQSGVSLSNANAMKTRPDTVVVVTCALASADKTAALIKSEYGDDVEYLVFDEKLKLGGVRSVDCSNADASDLMDKAAAASRVVVLAPGVSTLLKLASGVDSSLSEQMVLKSLLWGVNVEVWLDFKPVSSQRNTFFEKVSDSIGALESMGAGIRTYDCLPENRVKPLSSLVTERDVAKAHDEGLREIICASSAVITPSALDRASQFGIKIDKR